MTTTLASHQHQDTKSEDQAAPHGSSAEGLGYRTLGLIAVGTFPFAFAGLYLAHAVLVTQEVESPFALNLELFLTTFPVAVFTAGFTSCAYDIFQMLREKYVHRYEKKAPGKQK